MNRKEVKLWAKGKIKGHVFTLFGAIIIASLINGAVNVIIKPETSTTPSILASLIALAMSLVGAIISVGLVVYMVNFVKDKECDYQMIFSKFKNWMTIVATYILQSIYIVVFTILLIIPGIIKALGYALVPFILADDPDLGANDILKLSEKMMKGHKMDYFIFNLSFIGWFILGAFTFGILYIWLLPYQQTATTKFLLDIKENYKPENA